MPFLTTPVPDFRRVDAAYAPLARRARQAMFAYWFLALASVLLGYIPLTAGATVLCFAFMARRVYLMRRWHGAEKRAFYRAFQRARSCK